MNFYSVFIFINVNIKEFSYNCDAHVKYMSPVSLIFHLSQSVSGPSVTYI